MGEQTRLLELSELAKQMCLVPSSDTIQTFERLLEKPVARTREDLYLRGFLEERDEETVAELERLTRRLGLLSMLCVKKRASLCRRMNLTRCRAYGQPLFMEGESCNDFYIVLHGSFQCVGRVYNGQTTWMEFVTEVRAGQDFFYEMGALSPLPSAEVGHSPLPSNFLLPPLFLSCLGHIFQE